MPSSCSHVPFENVQVPLVQVAPVPHVIVGSHALHVAPLIALLLVLGVYPKPLLDIINPAVDHTMITIGQHDPAPSVPMGSLRPAEAPRTAEGPHR